MVSTRESIFMDAGETSNFGSTGKLVYGYANIHGHDFFLERRRGRPCSESRDTNVVDLINTDRDKLVRFLLFLI